MCILHFDLQAVENKKAYFAGGCFWCMEESFDQVEGVISTISGYSGGHLKNPKYADVIYTDSGHVEAIEVTYNPNIINYNSIINNCISCHQLSCQGPLMKINKLSIKN